MRFVLVALTTLALTAPALAGPRHHDHHGGPFPVAPRLAVGNVAVATNVQVGIVNQVAIARNGGTAFNIGSVTNTGGASASNVVNSYRY